MRIKNAGTTDEMVALMNEGGFDLVTASGDAGLRLIAGKRVQEVNTKLIPSWDKVDPRLQNVSCGCYLQKKKWNNVCHH